MHSRLFSIVELWGGQEQKWPPGNCFMWLSKEIVNLLFVDFCVACLYVSLAHACEIQWLLLGFWVATYFQLLIVSGKILVCYPNKSGNQDRPEQKVIIQQDSISRPARCQSWHTEKILNFIFPLIKHLNSSMDGQTRCIFTCLWRHIFVHDYLVL